MNYEVIKVKAHIEFMKRLGQSKKLSNGFWDIDLVPSPPTPNILIKKQ